MDWKVTERGWLPSGELTFCHGKSPFLMGKFTISMAILNCYVSSPKGKWMVKWMVKWMEGENTSLDL